KRSSSDSSDTNDRPAKRAKRNTNPLKPKRDAAVSKPNRQPAAPKKPRAKKQQPPAGTFTFAEMHTTETMYPVLKEGGLKTEPPRFLETHGREGFRGREAKLVG
ncbi:MAG: hypothetical protein Q9226_004878, partial [Calogaya cf. arnoldii]